MSGFSANHIPSLWILLSLFSVPGRYFPYVISLWLLRFQWGWTPCPMLNTIHHFQPVLIPRLSDYRLSPTFVMARLIQTPKGTLGVWMRRTGHKFTSDVNPSTSVSTTAQCYVVYKARESQEGRRLGWSGASHMTFAQEFASRLKPKVLCRIASKKK